MIHVYIYNLVCWCYSDTFLLVALFRVAHLVAASGWRTSGKCARSWRSARVDSMLRTMRRRLSAHRQIPRGGWLLLFRLATGQLFFFITDPNIFTSRLRHNLVLRYRKDTKLRGKPLKYDTGQVLWATCPSRKPLSITTPTLYKRE